MATRWLQASAASGREPEQTENSGDRVAWCAHIVHAGLQGWTRQRLNNNKFLVHTVVSECLILKLFSYIYCCLHVNVIMKSDFVLTDNL